MVIATTGNTMLGYHWHWMAWAGLVAHIASCSMAASEIDATSGALIYGEDDRRDVYEVTDAELRALALGSSLALLPNRALRARDDRTVEFDAMVLGEAFDLCEDQRFFDQPVLPRCSGTLVDDDLVLTAAHCIELWPCEQQIWAFDYAISESGRDPVLRIDSLFRCRSVAGRAYDRAKEGGGLDYAIVQLDRPVSGQRRVVPITRSAPRLNDPLCVFGYPSGLPLKIDCGARVLAPSEAQAGWLRLSSDTFVTSSGSGVFDETGALLAVLARGGIDYVEARDRTCFVVNEVTESSMPETAELASYATPAVEMLCASGWPSTRLCGRSSVCGDGVCSSDEHGATCPNDCPQLSLEGMLRPASGGCQLSTSATSTRVSAIGVVLMLFLRRMKARVRRE